MKAAVAALRRERDSRSESLERARDHLKRARDQLANAEAKVAEHVEAIIDLDRAAELMERKR